MDALDKFIGYALKAIPTRYRPVFAIAVIVLAVIGASIWAWTQFVASKTSDAKANQSPEINIEGNGNSIVLNQKIDVSDSSDELKEDVKRLIQEVRALKKVPHEQPVDGAAHFGSAFVFAGALRRPEPGRRNYIFDANDYALFIDASGALRFLAKDSAGEEFSAKLELNSATLQYDEFFVLICEAGTTTGRSFVRLWLNGRIVSNVDIDQELKFPSTAAKELVIGADLQGERTARFVNLGFISYSQTLSSAAKRQIVDKLPERGSFWAEFDGDWQRRDVKGNLSQPIQELQPRLVYGQ